jgi:2-dehydro-3-deoxyphosphogluconate aldolase/(4S)-4-hydroxy-2-oxoglutarate aldolase
MENKESWLKRFLDLGLVAVIRGPNPDLTLKMVEALVEGGVYGIEITYSTPNAAEVVKSLDQTFGDRILLGMGTLTQPAQAEEALQVGAKFLVSPHLDPELARAMTSTGLLMMMGAYTPTEVFQSHRLGSDIVKVFPGSLCGPAYFKALKGPYPYIPLMPTGGVSLENIGEWFSAGAVAVGAGSELCPTAWAKEGRFQDISQQARTFKQAVDNARQKK